MIRLISVIVIASFASVSAFAKNLKVEKSDRDYVEATISAEQVEGVEVRLTVKTMVDCNATTLSADPVYISGNNGIGLYDRYFMEVALFSTEMACPPGTAEEKVVKSEPWFVKSFTNDYSNGKVLITVIIPAGFDLEVKEIL